LTCRGIAICINEPAELGIVVAGLEIIEPGVIGVGVAMRAKKEYLQVAGNDTKNRTIGRSSLYLIIR